MRRQIYSLTLEDLAAFPIWEFADDEEGTDGQDEATARPRNGPPAFNLSRAYVETVMVKTEFISKSGAVYHGFCTPAFEESICNMHPVIITPHGQVMFYIGALSPSADELGTRYGWLETTPETLFPIRFRSLIDTPGLVCSGMIRAFVRRTLESPTLIEFT